MCLHLSLLCYENFTAESVSKEVIVRTVTLPLQESIFNFSFLIAAYFCRAHPRTFYEPYCSKRSVAPVTRAITLLPVDPVLQDSPVAHPRHASVGHGGAPSDHLPPATIP